MLKSPVRRTLWTTLALLVLTLAVSGCNLLPGKPTEVKIEPATITVDVGQTVDVLVNVANVKNLFAVELLINYDANLLEVVDANPNQEGTQIAPGDFLALDNLYINEANNGAIEYVLSQVDPHQPVNGDGTLVRITLKGKANGATSLVVTGAALFDRSGSGIPATAKNGTITITGTAAAADAPLPTNTPESPTPTPVPVPLTAQPTAVTFPTLAPGEGVNCARVLGYHVVQKGETVYAIGRVYATYPNAIAACNNLSDPGKIHIGNQLAIPYAPWSPIPPGPVAERQFLPSANP